MKSARLLLAALLLPAAVLAERPVLTEAPPDWWNFSFQPELHFSSVRKDNAEMAGIEIGARHNAKWHFGLAYRTLINDLDLNRPGYEDPEAGDLMTVTGVVRRHFTPCEWVDLALKLEVGGGTMETGDGEDQIDFTVVEPSLDFGLSLAKGMTLGVTMGHRWSSGAHSDLLSNKDLEGLTGTVYLRIWEF